MHCEAGFSFSFPDVYRCHLFEMNIQDILEEKDMTKQTWNMCKEYAGRKQSSCLYLKKQCQTFVHMTFSLQDSLLLFGCFLGANSCFTTPFGWSDLFLTLHPPAPSFYPQVVEWPLLTWSYKLLFLVHTGQILDGDA